MNFLLIEDEEDFVGDVKATAEGRATIFAPMDVGLLRDFAFPPDGPAEDQLAVILSALIREHEIDLVVLDTDLSHAQGKLEAQSGYRIALQKLGMPVCRYRKGASETQFTWWQRLQRAMQEGADAIWIPRSMVSDDVDKLVPWLSDIATGFKTLATRLQARPELLSSAGEFGPADVLAIVLEKPEAKVDFLGYTSQSLFYFAAANVTHPSALRNDCERFATRLGYWLFNYIMTFPGPILPAGAAAAFLNLTVDSFADPAVQEVVQSSLYTGPFASTGTYYWRSDLAQLLDGVAGDIAQAPGLTGKNLARLDSADHGAEAFWCVLSQEPVLSADTAPNPEWIPSGASQSRVTQSRLDELGPLLSI